MKKQYRGPSNCTECLVLLVADVYLGISSYATDYGIWVGQTSIKHIKTKNPDEIILGPVRATFVHWCNMTPKTTAC